MPRMKMTSLAVERLRAPKKEQQVDYFDAAFPGLALRVTRKGVKTWSYHGRLHGRLRRVTLGRWPAVSLKRARELAGEAAEAMAEGRDLTAEKREAREARERDTFEAVMQEWLRKAQGRNKSREEAERTLRHDALPAWRKRPVQHITRRDCRRVIDQVAERGSLAQAGKLHSRLKTLFTWCVQQDILDASPMEHLPPPTSAKARDRVLIDDELKAVWLAAERVGFPYGAIVHLLILTGARLSEVSELSWDEVQLEDGAALHLAGERTKNGVAQTIPLSATALAYMDRLPRVATDDGGLGYVFTVNGRTPFSGFSKAKRRLDREAEALYGEPIPPWRLHDLRRTVATNLQKLGCQLEVIEAVLGHVSGSRAGIVGVYQRHRFEDEKRAALCAWAARVQTLLGRQAKSAEVHLLRR